MNIIKSKKIVLASFLILAATLVIIGICNKEKPAVVFTDASFSGTSQAVALGSYQYYDNYEMADEFTDLVLIGDVIKVNEPEELTISPATTTPTGEIVPPDKDIYIVSDVKVDKVMKGNIKKGDIVKVKQIYVVYESTEFYKQGERRLFFLQTYETPNMPASPINPLQGSSLILDGKVKKSNHFQFIHDGVSEDDFVEAVKDKMKG